MDRSTQRLSASEIMTSGGYAQVRPSYLRRIVELKRRRRVALGPHASLQFECRDTVLYTIHELIRADGSWTQERVEREIDEQSPLLPTGDALTATFLLHGGGRDWACRLCERLATHPGDVLRLQVGERSIAAEQVMPPVDPYCPVQYLRFAIDPEVAGGMAEARRPAWLELRSLGRVLWTALSRETRRELAADLG